MDCCVTYFEEDLERFTATASSFQFHNSWNYFIFSIKKIISMNSTICNLTYEFLVKICSYSTKKYKKEHTSDFEVKRIVHKII